LQQKDLLMPEILKTPDILRRYRITKPTLRRWLRRGDFPAPMRVRNRSMWTAETVAAWETARAAHV
jgi:predicted DNA-binding transcriptional regulator AlpA